MVRRGRRRLAWSAGLLMLSLAAPSCTAILGIGKDYREQDGGPGAGGAGGHGGTSDSSSASSGSASASTSSSGTSSSSAQSSSSSNSGGSCMPPSCTGCADCQVCVTCAEAGPCATQFNTCKNDASCTGLFTCLGLCGNDKVCVMNCVSSYPNGVNHLNALNSCVMAACTPPC